MSEHAEGFIRYLLRLNGEVRSERDSNRSRPLRDSGAMAALRRSLSFDPGAYPGAFPYVEPFLVGEGAFQNARRRAYYVAAGLYALNPVQSDQPFAGSLARLAQKRAHRGGSADGVEARLMALLGAHPEGVARYLRQLTTLLAAGGEGCDYVALVDDLCIWLNPSVDFDRLCHIRQKWARQFYRVAPQIDE